MKTRAFPLHRCYRCTHEFPAEQLVDRNIPWEDGGQAGYDEVLVCRPCAKKLDEAEAYEEHLRDPFNESYERARAQGWSD